MTDVLFPVGRMIGGSVYKAAPKLDNFGKPKLNADGTPATAFNFGVAIPKKGEQHWSQTPWGALIVAEGQRAYPSLYQNPTFAWKIKDGDSTAPNKNGKIMREQEGCAGNWIIWFSQTWAPKLVTDKGQVPLIEPEAVVPGYYVEVFASVVGNAPSPSPGVYLNPMAVNRVAYGERMASVSVDTTSVGFGQNVALPPGASLTPVGGGFTPPAPSQAAQPSVGGFHPYPAATPQAQVAPAPNPAFLAIPAVPAAPPAKQMTAKAGGATYEQMIGGGWNDALLIQHGYMVQ